MGGLDAWKGSKKMGNNVITCLCGRKLPSMARLLWNCPRTEQLRTDMGLELPIDRAGERLLLVGRPPKPLHVGMLDNPFDINRDWCTTLLRLLRTGGHTLVVATDGGFDKEVGTAGFACTDRDQWNIVSCGCLVSFEDNQSFAAELFAFTKFLQALLVAACSGDWTGHIVCVVDCGSALELMECDPSLSLRFAWIRHTRFHLEHLAALGITIGFHWVPSHFRHVEGYSPPPGLSEDQARQINDCADRACTRVRSCVGQSDMEAWVDLCSKADSWQDLAISFASRVGELYLQHLSGSANEV